MNPDAVPAELSDRDHWVVWAVEHRGGKETKVPYQPAQPDQRADVPNEPSHRSDFETAVAAVEEHDRLAGIGYVFDSDDLVVGVDLDHCRDSETGELDAGAAEIVERLDSFTEVSPSGSGLHVYVLGVKPGDRCRRGNVEMYDTDRFFTVTGDHLDETPATVEPRPEPLVTVYREHIEDDSSKPEPTAPPAEVNLDDAELLERAFAAENGDRFERLWNGDTSMHDGDHSRADLALLCNLAFWTGGDRARMERLFGRSGLVRGKWRDRPDYRERSIDAALAQTTEFYDPKPAEQRTTPDGGSTAAQPPTDSQPSVESPTGVNDLEIGDVYDVLDIAPDVPLGKIDNNQLANGIETLYAAQPDVHLRVLDSVDARDEEIYAMDLETMVWEAKGKQRLGQLSRRLLGMHNSKAIQSELANALRTNPDGYWLVGRDEFGAPADHLPVHNGLLHLETGALRDPEPEDYLLGRTPTDYDPDASIDGTRFEQFLMQAASPADLEKLQEYAGYCLLHSEQPYKKALFLFGPTNSGKGTFIEVLTMILGQENISSESLYSLLCTRWGYHSIYGAWLNVSNELTPGGLSNIEKFKTLTGGEDRVTAEDKGISKYEFTVTQKFIFATNQFPAVEDADEAFFKRCLFVEFPNTVPDDKLDPELVAKLTQERSAILNWMIDGLHRLRDRGGQFTNERDYDEKRDLTRAFGSPIDQFAYRAFEATNVPEHVVSKKELYAAFTRFCDYIEKDTPTQRAFTRRLKEISGITDGKSRRVDAAGTRTDVFKGLRLNREFFKKIQATVPSHDDGEDMDRQGTLG